MADTAAALVIQLSADFKQFQKEMRAATGVFDAEGRKIEQRQRQLKKNLSDWSGISNNLGKVVLGGAALAGVEQFVSSIVEAASQLKDTSNAIGVGTDELQAWGLLAEHAGIKQDIFNESLDKFSKSLGDASVKGGQQLKFFQALGVDVKGDATTAFYQFADAVANTSSKQQQNSLVTTAFGKKMANLTPVLAEGSAALKAQVAQLAASGQIIQRDAVPKIDELGNAWSDLKRQFIATGANSLAEPLETLAKQLADPQVQSGLKTFATLLADIAVQLAKAAKYAPIVAGAYAGFRVGRFAGPEGGAAGAVIGAITGGSLGGVNTQTADQLQKRIDALKQTDPNKKLSGTQADIARLEGLLVQAKAAEAKLAAPAVEPAKTGGVDRGDLTGQDALKQQEGAKQLADLQVQDAKRVRDATLKANEDIRDSNLDEIQSGTEAAKAQDDALLQQNQGSEHYFDLQKKIIIELANLDIKYTKEKRDAALAALDDRAKAEDQAAADERSARKTQLDLLVSQDKISRGQANKALADFDASQAAEKAQRDQGDAARRVALEEDTANQIKAINAKKNSDIDQAGPSALIRQANTQGREQIQQYEDETAVLGLVTGAAAKLAFVQGQLNDARAKGIILTAAEIAAINQEGDAVGKAAQKAHDAQEETGKAIQLTDEVRSGLEDTLAAGLQGFDNLGDAAKNFIAQLAQIILKLYVLEPLLKGPLGEQGTTGGGWLGTLVKSIAGSFFGGSTLDTKDLIPLDTAGLAGIHNTFAEGGYTGPGGPNQPAGIVHKGEGVLSQADMRALGGPSGFAALRSSIHRGYADGGIVGRAMPSLPSVKAQPRSIPSLVLNIDARYATKGVSEQIRDELTRSYPLLVRAAVQESDKKFPTNLSNNLRDRA